MVKGYPRYERETFSSNIYTFTKRRIERTLTKIATRIQFRIKISTRPLKGDIALYHLCCVRYPPSHTYTPIKHTYTQPHKHKYIHIPTQAQT